MPLNFDIDKPDYDDPNLGVPDFALSHPVTFASILNTSWRVYQQGRHDEAMRASRQEAVAMERDCFLMGLMDERFLGTTSLKWSIEVDNEKDTREAFVKDAVTASIKKIPQFKQLLDYLLFAVWYGRYGARIVWDYKPVRIMDPRDKTKSITTKVLTIAKHQPLNGDKIAYTYDGIPAIMVNSGQAIKFNNADIVNTNIGLALALRGNWQDHFVIHRHRVKDSDFFEADTADAINGYGVRSVIYWLNWLRQEYITNVADWCARVGLGVRLWYYQMSNPESKRAVQEAAHNQSDRVNLLIPRNAQGQEGVEFVDTSGTGAQLLLELQKHLEDVIQRYIIGQTLSSGTEGSGLGGTGVADLHAATKSKIIAYDASNLAETVTTQIVEKMVYWSFPEMRGMGIRFVFAIDQPNPLQQLQAAKLFTDMGCPVKESEVRASVGFTEPMDGDKVISMEEQARRQMKLQMESQAQQMALQMHFQQAQQQAQMAQMGDMAGVQNALSGGENGDPANNRDNMAGLDQENPGESKIPPEAKRQMAEELAASVLGVQ